MRQHQRAIALLQWCVVALYAGLLVTPFFFSPPTPDDKILAHPALFVQFVFWSVGWPLIFISIIFFGRAWCGVFCPDGTLTEYVSKHGRQQSIPRWIRWSGWPCMMLVVTTVYGQLVGVYEQRWGTLLLLGLPTLGALWCGYAYANGKRIWCMYLCPANGPFSLLSKIAPLHFRVDEERWKQRSLPPSRVDCPTLIDIRRMKSTSACHMCGRCAGHMNSVELDTRSPDNEILSAHDSVRTSEAATLLIGLLGVCTMATRWRESRLFDWLKSTLTHSPFSTLNDYIAPWWMLANHPNENQVFSLLEGLAIILHVLLGGVVVGLVLMTLVKLATRIAGNPQLTWQKLSLSLIPVGSIGMFLGLTALSVTRLRHEGMHFAWLPYAQLFLLLGGGFFSFWLAARLILTKRTPRQFLALFCFGVSAILIQLVWIEKLFK